jgi:uncharacterized membrane protein
LQLILRVEAEEIGRTLRGIGACHFLGRRLIGADLTNLDKVRGLGASVASIGGAGTSDGIFLSDN